MSDLRTCNACREAKPLDDFYASSGKWVYSCKDCYKAYQKAYRDANPKAGLPDGDERHGTVSGYTYHKCRCDACKTAQSTYMAQRRQEARKAKMSTRGPGSVGNAADGHTGALAGRYSNGPACKDLPTRLFYPETGEQATEAKAICRGCSERIPCALKGVEGIEYGVWGSLTTDDRRKVRRDMNQSKNPELVICLACDTVMVADADNPAAARCWSCGSHHEIDGLPQR